MPTSELLRVFGAGLSGQLDGFQPEGSHQSNSQLVHHRERKANLYRYWNRCRYRHHSSRRAATSAL